MTKGKDQKERPLVSMTGEEREEILFDTCAVGISHLRVHMLLGDEELTHAA